VEAGEGHDGILDAICLEGGSDFIECGVDLCLLQVRSPMLSSDYGKKLNTLLLAAGMNGKRSMGMENPINAFSLKDAPQLAAVFSLIKSFRISHESGSSNKSRRCHQIKPNSIIMGSLQENFTQIDLDHCSRLQSRASSLRLM
jgi:hypothetical protein